MVASGGGNAPAARQTGKTGSSGRFIWLWVFGSRCKSAEFPAHFELIMSICAPDHRADQLARLLAWQRRAQPALEPPTDQIPISGTRLDSGPRVPSSDAFGRRPSQPADTPRPAGIRNPSRKRSFRRATASEVFRPSPALKQIGPVRPNFDIGRAISGRLATTSGLF
jgi:hypothetical protein